MMINRQDDVGAYLPSPEKIKEECKKLREKHLEEMRKKRSPGKDYHKEAVPIVKTYGRLPDAI